MKTMANIGRTSMTIMGYTTDQHTEETTIPTIKIKTTMQLCAITVVNLDTLRENTIVIQPASAVVTFHMGIEATDSSLGLASANNMAD